MGLRSVCNHFTGKSGLFAAAVNDALEEYAQAVDERLRGVGDPAERLAEGVRLSACMAESYPEIMQILRHSELGRICAGDGLAPRARRGVERGMAAGPKAALMRKRWMNAWGSWASCSPMWLISSAQSQR
ncbi:hypothetical protein [Streptomyces sp. NPDC002205]|uniref:hypothetical protein n=1 Tax=Streptomyces sp. NPDC002205 TaxID=3154411 RepID=UPI00332E9572